MAQRRLINRSLGSSIKMLELVRIAGPLADFCHALFPLLVVNSDDHGRQEGDAATIKFRVFPVSPHPEDDFERALVLMERVGLLSLYSVSGRRYLVVHKFRAEQPGIKYVAKSCCPEPPQEVTEGQRLAGFHRIERNPGPDEEKKLGRSEEKGNDEDAPLAHSAAGAASESPSNGSVGAPAMKASSHEAEGSHPQRKIRQPSRSRRAPEDFRVTEQMREWAARECPQVDVDSKRRFFSTTSSSVRRATGSPHGATGCATRQSSTEVAMGEQASLTDGHLLGLHGTSRDKDDCPDCQGTSWILVDRKARRCECQRRRIREARICTVLEDWPEYADADLDRFKPRTIGQTNALAEIRADPMGSYLLTGMYGSGKTRLLVAQYIRLAAAGIPCALRSAKQLVEELRLREAAPRDGQPPPPSPVLDGIATCDRFHLFVDDIEKAAARTDWRAEAIFDVLDTIKRRRLGLSATTNLAMGDLAAAIGDAALARIDAVCRLVKI